MKWFTLPRIAIIAIGAALITYIVINTIRIWPTNLTVADLKRDKEILCGLGFCFLLLVGLLAHFVAHIIRRDRRANETL